MRDVPQYRTEPLQGEKCITYPPMLTLPHLARKPYEPDTVDGQAGGV